MKKARRDLLHDIIFILIGVFLAIVLSKLGFISWFLDLLDNQYFASFFSGIFFTSAFTIAPSAIALASIDGLAVSQIALWGALGALCGDLIIFFFIRDRFAKDIIASVRPSVIKHILNSFHLGFMKYISPILGALIIASPLPDEFGLTLLGLSRIRVSILIPISYAMNYLGIYLLLSFARVV